MVEDSYLITFYFSSSSSNYLLKELIVNYLYLGTWIEDLWTY